MPKKVIYYNYINSLHFSNNFQMEKMSVLFQILRKIIEYYRKLFPINQLSKNFLK